MTGSRIFDKPSALPDLKRRHRHRSSQVMSTAFDPNDSDAKSKFCSEYRSWQRETDRVNMFHEKSGIPQRYPSTKSILICHLVPKHILLDEISHIHVEGGSSFFLDSCESSTSENFISLSDFALGIEFDYQGKLGIFSVFVVDVCFLIYCFLY